MKSILQPCWQGARFCTSCVWSFVVWSVWLLLAVLLLLQVWWLTTQELAVPRFALHAIEQRLAASGLHATFGRTVFDPSGRVLVEEVQLFSPSFPEPLATARALYVRFDPWALAIGQFEPRQFRAHGVEFLVPAMLSPTGAHEPLVRHLDLTLTTEKHDVTIDQLTARIGPVEITARGSLYTAAWDRQRHEPLPIAEFIAKTYPQLSRQLAPHLQQLSQLSAPRLHLDFVPSEPHGAIVSATFLAEGAEVAAPTAIQVADLRLSTQFALSLNKPSEVAIDVHAGEISLPELATIDRLGGKIRGTLRPEERSFSPTEAELSAARVTHRNVLVETPAAVVSLRTPHRGRLVAGLFGETVAIDGTADLTRKTATLHLDAQLAPAWIPTLAQHLQRDLSSLLSLREAPTVTGEIEFGPDWKFASAAGHVSAENLVARTVPLDDFSAHVAFAGTQFAASNIVLRQGENLARGSFSTDVKEHDFRFLLTGELRPLDISGWFREWWPKFFSTFDFAAAAPAADVDVQGRWRAPRETSVMISVDAESPSIRGVPFDRVKTRLFIRPNFFDGLEVWARRERSEARGTFTRWVDLDAGPQLRRMEFDVISNLDLHASAKVFGDVGSTIVEPFQFEAPPQLQLRGTIDGPAAPDGPGRDIQVQAESAGDFSFFDFPLKNLKVAAEVRDDEITVDRVAAGFADGFVTGRAQLSGRGEARTLAFDCALQDSNLAEAITTVEHYTARRRNDPVPATSAFLEKAEAVRLDLGISAEGRYNDLLSFHGSGNATLEGAELGKVRLLGLLSELLSFTSLSVNTARANFVIDGPRLAFTEVKLTGDNTAIDAKGIYALDRKELDFTAKVFPFAESRFFLKNIMDVVLTPISQVLEVKLTGPLRDPSWAFLIGPTNIFRSITQSPTPPVRTPAGTTSSGAISPYLRR